MTDVLHNFQCFNSEVRLEPETEEMTPPKKGMPVPKPAKPVQPVARGLYEMIDGKLPDKPLQTKTPRPATKRPGRLGFWGVVKKALTTFFGHSR